MNEHTADPMINQWNGTTIEPFLTSGHIVINGTSIMGVNEVWCTFPNDLLNELSDEQKKEMFQRIQKIIDDYSSMVTPLIATNDAMLNTL